MRGLQALRGVHWRSREREYSQKRTKTWGAKIFAPPPLSLVALEAANALPPPLLLVLCGLPASGKSTLCRALCSHPALDVRLVSYDDPPLPHAAAPGAAPPAPWTPARWHAERSASFQAVAAALCACMQEAAACAAAAPPPPPPPRRRLVLVDDNAWLRSMRRPFYALAREAGASYLTLHLSLGPGGEGVAAARDAARAARGAPSVGPAVIARMAAALQPPSAAPGSSWEAPYAWVLPAAAVAEDGVGCQGATAAAAADGSGSGAEAALLRAVLARLLGGEALPRPPPLPPPSPAAPAAPPAATLLHRADLALRAGVAALLAAAAPRERGALAAALAARKAAAWERARACAAAGALEGELEAWGGREGEEAAEAAAQDAAAAAAAVVGGTASGEAAAAQLLPWALAALRRAAQ